MSTNSSNHDDATGTASSSRPSIRRKKPIRTMISTTADTVTATMEAIKDGAKTIGLEIKTARLESTLDFQLYVKECAKELNKTDEEVLALLD